MGSTELQLVGDREIVISRTFNAPARIVFAAWTDPQLVRQWWAPRSMGGEVASSEADVRVGGAYRYVTRANGQGFAFFGEYLEVSPPDRVVYTQLYEPMAHVGAAVITVTFEERDGRTLLTSREVYPSEEVRDGVLASGMEEGMRETMDQLDALVTAPR